MNKQGRMQEFFIVHVSSVKTILQQIISTLPVHYTLFSSKLYLRISLYVILRW